MPDFGMGPPGGADPMALGAPPPGPGAPPLGPQTPPPLGGAPPGGGLDGGMGPMGPPPAPLPPPPPPGQDPILAQMLAASPPTPLSGPVRTRKKLPKPDLDDISAYAQSDKRFYTRRNNRFARDTEIFRQWQSGVPSDFDEIEDVRWIGAAMSNLVNRMANLMGGLEVYIEAPYKDDPGEESAQKIEDFLYNCLDYNRRLYARGGGASLQRDEFFYLFLRGWLVGRVLPDLADQDYPFAADVLDPATCYPIWGSDKAGMTRMTRQYSQTSAELLATYGPFNPKLKDRMLFDLGTDGSTKISEHLTKEWTVIEYWDQDWRGVMTSDGLEVLPVKEHGLRGVPFVMVSAVGEPKGFQSPDSASGYMDPVYGPMPTGNSGSMDQAQKGVSVMHYLINTHRLGEALKTLLYAEVEKASDPATIRYRAPQLLGTDVPDVDYKRKGTNEAAMGLEKLEGLPTSPHPTDLSPLLQSLDQDWVGGAMAAPGAGGMDVGPNASGYSLDTLIASAKELVLPYLHAFENYKMLTFQMKLEQCQDIILPLMPLSAPQTSTYGANAGIHTITSQDLDAVGTEVRVRVKNINDSNRPAVIQSAIQRLQAGLISQKAAMDETGVRNPDKMFAQILSEKALQHPMVQDMFAIPSALQNMGAQDLANFWLQAVVMPQIQQQQMQMGAMGPGGVPGGPPGGPPNQGGTSNVPQPGAPPGGPPPGLGRGPAPPG